MKKFNSLFKIGTKVWTEGGIQGEIEEIHPTRQWVKIKGIAGHFQRGHIKKFSNK